MDKIAVNYEKMYYGFPVVFISYYDRNGHPNVTPISSSYTLKDMMMLGFNTKGYAVGEIKEVKDFVVNLAAASQAEAMDYCGTRSGRDVHKFDEIPLTPVPSANVNAPLIEECPVSIECSVAEVVESAEFPGITHIMARIKGRLIAPELLDEQERLKPSMLDNIVYAGDGVKRGYRYLSKVQAPL